MKKSGFLSTAFQAGRPKGTPLNNFFGLYIQKCKLFTTGVGNMQSTIKCLNCAKMPKVPKIMEFCPFYLDSQATISVKRRPEKPSGI